MSPATAALVAFALAATLVHLLTAVIVAARSRRARRLRDHPYRAGRVTLIRTIRDADALEVETLRSSFTLTHPDHEVIFCAASEDDAAVPVARALMGFFPHVRARLLIGDDCISANPKLNNMVKGWREARSPWVVFADSNLMLPSDYLERVLSAWTVDAGAVCAPPVGSRPSGLAAEIECAFLNTYQARWQYAADSVGFGFAQGKTMLFRRDLLNQMGGIGALASELAEDAAATKIVRGAGFKVRLAGPSFFQPLGVRTFSEVVARQLRWAQLRRATFPVSFALEALTGSLLPIGAGTMAAAELGVGPLAALAALVALWLGAEAALARVACWPLSWRSPVAWLVRDVLILVIWLRAWTARSYEWRGHMIAHHGDGSARMANKRAATDGAVG